MLKPVAIGLSILFLGAAVLLVLSYAPDLPREQLEARYLEGPQDLIEIDGTTLHVRDAGGPGGQAVVMIHGFASSLQTWDGWAEALSARHRILRLDLPGSGLSLPDPTGDYSDERSISLLRALLDAKGIKEAVFVGNSIGGRIAWTFAVRNPGRVSALVLVSPDGFASEGFEYGVPADVPDALALMRFILPRWFLRSGLEDSYGDPARLSEETVDRYYDLVRAPGARTALVERLRQTVLNDPRPLLPGIEVPVLLMWGKKDALIPVQNAQDYLSLLPDARLVTFDDLGHVPQEEAPERSVGPVSDFLDALKAR